MAKLNGIFEWQNHKTLVKYLTVVQILLKTLKYTPRDDLRQNPLNAFLKPFKLK